MVPVSVRRGSWERLIGPIFHKDLRVASRRRRTYLLRAVYVLLLLAYLASVWIPAVALVRFGAMSRAQMQVAAHTITQGIVWFQFLGAQGVMLLLMSTSISEEVYRRTLGTLLMTPLSSRQVLLNKFFSRLFQVLLLVAVSLPLLALVRVLGGIAWGYLVVSLCITAATVAFVGSVSLFFSVLCRRAHLAVIASVLSLVSAFVLLPVFLGAPLRTFRTNPEMLAALNPYLLLRCCGSPTTRLLTTRTMGPGTIVFCCGVLLFATGTVLLCSEILMQRVALRRAMGEPVLLDRLRHGRWRDRVAPKRQNRPARSIRRVVGPPMVWKELICTFSGRQKFAGRMVLGLEILLILIVLSFPALMTLVPYEILHRMYIWGLLGLAVLTTAIVSAGVMSTEKEARTWPVLLLTPLTDREILLGKSAGVLRRCGPVWLLLLAYIAGFAYAGFFHPLAVVQMTIVVLTILPFLAATGFYFGLRLHRMTDAVTASLVLAGLLWGVGPVLAHAAGLWIDGLWQQAGAGAWTMVPWSQVAYMTVTTLDGHVNPTWEFDLNAGQFTCRMLVSMAGHLLVALLFAWPAVRAFRRGML